MTAVLQCQYEFGCPAFLFANEVWSLVKKEEDRNAPDARSFAVSAVINAKRDYRSKQSRFAQSHEDLLNALNHALGSNGNVSTYVESASKFMQFDEQLMALVVGLDKLAVEKVTRSREIPVVLNGSVPSLDFFSGVVQNRSEIVRHHWERINTILTCIQTHMRNAAEYHCYFSDCADLTTCMATQGLHLMRLLDKDRIAPLVKQSDLDATLKVLVDTASSFRYYQERLCDLRNRAYSSVCPIQYRTKPVLQDCRLPARCIVDAEFDGITIRKKQDLFILDNANPTVWLVRTIEGDVLEIPSIFVEIRAPCEEALDCYEKLVTRTIDIWSEVVKVAADYLIWLNFVIFTNVNDKERESLRATPQVSKSRLLHVVDLFRSTFGTTWKDFSGFYRVEAAVSRLIDEISVTESSDLADKMPFITIVDRLSACVSTFDNFVNNWKRFATAAQLCRAPEAFLIVDRMEFRRDADALVLMDPAEQEELIKFQWRSKLERQNEKWDERRALPNQGISAQTQTETIMVDQEVEVNIVRPSAEAAVDCTMSFKSTEMQTDSDLLGTPVQTQTEISVKNQIVEANIGRPTTDAVVDCTTSVQTDEVQTEATGTPVQTQTEIAVKNQTVEANIGRPTTDAVVDCTISIKTNAIQTELLGTPVQTQTVIAVKNQTVEANIGRPSTDAVVDCTVSFKTNEVQTVPELKSPRATQTEQSVTKDKGVDAKILRETAEKMIDCVVPTNSAEVQTFKPGMSADARRKALSVARVLSALGTHGLEAEVAHTSERIESMQMASSNAEEEQRLAMTGAVDMARDVIVPLEEAVERRIVDQEKGTFRDTLTNKIITIREAMEAGLIVMEMKVVSRTVKDTSYGVITIIREQHKRSCKIMRVTDSKTGKRLSAQRAIYAGILDKDRNWVLDVSSGERLSLGDAITRKLVEVRQTEDEAAEENEDNSVTKQYEVRSIVDRKTGQSVGYHEAIRSGLLNAETGDFTDTLTGTSVPFMQAVKLNYIAAKLCEVPVTNAHSAS